ncbi:hypothetical protein TVAG_159280 [Trichomonas vaginalis G3]|uniref:Uncharacterized protein n=1 Tax=Trichomonas vaginalis (strain ATCC PRA-98 / G3) TaxID=412133 RepID=A2F583_TRIV3|nr:hypothetical protein TVAGG3_0160180 [Trichomonas vaginalis G3]EAX99908.1 hypothetical protein TVAG_159280 [Trichomonas vaginalis G3]KAI5547811.1 hypothetical protein TVAGG3_0160180 [Trichomonas vaginalis G3]|eukprot:XP_001312838.1 hypothetical protein [Trichomonas vaginalis G3]
MPWDRSHYMFGFGDSEMGKDSQIIYQSEPNGNKLERIVVPWMVVKYILAVKKYDFDKYFTSDDPELYVMEQRLRYYFLQYLHDPEANPLVFEAQYHGALLSHFYPHKFAEYGRAIILFLVFTGREIVRYEWINSLKLVVDSLYYFLGYGYPCEKEDLGGVALGLIELQKRIPFIKNDPKDVCPDLFRDYHWYAHIRIYSKISKEKPFLFKYPIKLTEEAIKKINKILGKNDDKK